MYKGQKIVQETFTASVHFQHSKTHLNKLQAEKKKKKNMKNKRSYDSH